MTTATISFGLVSIPVKVYASGESGAAVSFNLLHRECGSRLKQQYICPQCDTIVEREGMAKGYEFAKGQYVLFGPEELRAIEQKSTQEMEITEFLPTREVDPVYFEKSYYLGPGKGGDRAYRLLSEALEKSGRSALAKYASRGKQYLVLLRPVDGKLVMQQLRYADEVREIADVPVGDAEVKPGEIELALQIVEQAVSESFEPERYEDEVRQRVMDLVQQKVAGQEITAEPSEEPKAQVIDLMEALKASLAGKGDERRPARSAEPRRAAQKSATRPAAKTAKRKAGSS